MYKSKCGTRWRSGESLFNQLPVEKLNFSRPRRRPPCTPFTPTLRPLLPYSLGWLTGLVSGITQCAFSGACLFVAVMFVRCAPAVVCGVCLVLSHCCVIGCFFFWFYFYLFGRETEIEHMSQEEREKRALQ